MKRHRMFCPIYHARPSQTINRWLKRINNKTVRTQHDKGLRFLWRTLSLCPVNEENNSVRVDADLKVSYILETVEALSAFAQNNCRSEI